MNDSNTVNTLETGPEAQQPPPSTNKPFWGPWQTVGLGIAILIFYFLAQGFVAIVVLTIAFAADPNLITSLDIENLPLVGLIVSVGMFVSAMAGCGVIAVAIKAHRGTSLKDYLSLQPISLKVILVLLAAALVFTVIESAISYFAGISQSNDIMINAYHTSVWPPLFWLATVIFAPLFEETFFRGFLFAGLQRSRIGVIGTILVTSLVWTSLHALQYDWYGLTVVFLLGILLGVVRHRTGSLWSPLLMHAFWNLLATIALALTAAGVI